MNAPNSFTITRLGRDGDGCAETPTGPVFIPGALPGETFAAQPDGSYVRIGAASPGRVVAPCRHFGVCGGCVAQHMGAATYRAWKEGLVRSAFQTQALKIELEPLFIVPPGSRRRAAFTATIAGGRARLGFHARRSHTLIDLHECPVLLDPIANALPALREIAQHIAATATPTKQGTSLELRIDVAALSGGLDVSIHGTGKAPAMVTAAQLAVLARRAGFARLTVEDLGVYAEGAVTLVTEAGAIVPPPGAFFQAVAEAERHMAALIVAGVGKAKRVADLFAGSGTFSLPLAKRARVLAVDSDKQALTALSQATRHATGLKPIEARWRDLLAEPLSPLELAEVDAVVFDPPRSGAKAQSEMLAKSKIATVVAASCNPVTLARDCRTLVDAGFSMGPVQPIDQFLWSPHVEAIVTLTRRR